MRKPREEVMRRYVEGAIISASRLWRHWIRRGLSDEEALSRAIKQAYNMIKSSGLSNEEVIETLSNIVEIANRLLNLVKEEGRSIRH